MNDYQCLNRYTSKIIRPSQQPSQQSPLKCNQFPSYIVDSEINTANDHKLKKEHRKAGFNLALNEQEGKETHPHIIVVLKEGNLECCKL